MKETKEQKHARGFTLTEIVLVVTLLGILSLAVFTVFKGALDSWTVSEARTQSFENARAALEQMAKEIRCAVVNDRPSVSNFPIWELKERFDFVGFGADAAPQVPNPPGKGDQQNNDMDSPSEWRTNSAADEVYFIAALTPGEKSEAELCKVGYFLDGAGNVLRRFYGVDPGGPASPTLLTGDYDFTNPPNNRSSKSVAEGVVDFRVWYWDGESKDTNGDGVIDVLDTPWQRGIDDDGDNLVDEELENLVDDDGDGAVDEDIGWQNSWDSRRGTRRDPSGNMDSYNGARYDGRETGRLPRAVKISITVEDEFARITRTFTTVVYLTNFR